MRINVQVRNNEIEDEEHNFYLSVHDLRACAYSLRQIAKTLNLNLDHAMECTIDNLDHAESYTSGFSNIAIFYMVWREVDYIIEEPSNNVLIKVSLMGPDTGRKIQIEIDR